MYTTLCLQWEPEVVAISLMYMAFKMANLENENAPDWHDRNPGDQWWDQFVSNLTPDMMEEVCHKVLDYYTASSADNGMPSSTISPFEMNGRLFAANASAVPSGPMRSLSTPTTPARTVIRQPEVKPSYSVGHP